MNHTITEKPNIIQNNLIVPSYEYFCHHCSKKVFGQEQLTCSNPVCSNNYCIPCLVNFYQNTPLDIQTIQNNPFYSFWKCPKCQGKCFCNKCKIKNSPVSTDTEDHNKNNDFLGKKINSDAELIMWLSTGEDTSIDIQSVKFPFVPLNSRIKSKVFDKLIKIAKQCELFYRHKCKNEYIKKNCANCFETNFHQNDLLRFFNYETFLYYMKYLFYVSNKIVCYSKENFNNNKIAFEELFKQFKEKKEIWTFKDTKIICKQCMYFLINKPNFFDNIKGIFLRQEKKFFLFSNSSINNNLNEFENNNNLNSKEKNDIFNNKNNKDIILSKNVFKIVKSPKIQKNVDCSNKSNIVKKSSNSNIVINYNNHNNNIYNTLILNDENQFNKFGINVYGEIPQIPVINNYYVNYNNLFNEFTSVKSNYYQLFFFELKREITDLIKIANLSKNDNDRSKYLSLIDLLNKKIINNFSLIENSVINNVNYLNSLFSKNSLNLNDIEFIEIKKKVVEYFIENKNFLNQLNFLRLNYLNIENIFISALFQ
jgi:hypothetical protein